MSRKKNKSRLTKTDINTICEMQRKIDVYESYILGLCAHSNLNLEKEHVVLMRGTELDDFVNLTWRRIKQLKVLAAERLAETKDLLKSSDNG